MLTLPAAPETLEIKRVLRALSHHPSLPVLSPKGSFSPPWTPTRERTHPLAQSVTPKTVPLTWKTHPKGTYSPEQEASGASYAYMAELGGEIPVSSKEMHILAEGDVVGDGVIQIYEDSENKLLESDVLVDVRVFYDNPQVTALTSISYVHSQENENGLRIHTAPAQSAEIYRRFTHINVRIPRSIAPESLKLPAFRTHLPNFTHIVAHLRGIVDFSTITLSSADKPIIAKSLSAHKIRLRTTNGAIQGTFISDAFVGLRTANAPINAEVVLSNAGKETSNLELISTNAEVAANVSLTSTAAATEQPSYRIIAKSTNHAVSLGTPSVPLGASTQIDVQTSNAPATLRLPPTFEGAFSLHATPVKPVVAQTTPDAELVDPKGLGRRRALVSDRERRGLLSGSVVWVAEGEVPVAEKTEKSSVSVKTSNAEAKLVL